MSNSVRGRVSRSPFVLRLVTAIALATSVGAVASACGPKTKKQKTIKDDKPKGPNAGALLVQARNLRDQGDIDGADAKYLAAYGLNKDYAIVEERVTMLIENRRADTAVAAANEYYEGNPTDAKGSHLYAQALIAQGNFTDALSVAEELLALDDNDAAAHEKRGRALILGQRVAEGIEELRRAVSIEPKNGAFLIELGSGLLLAKMVDEAALQLRAAILFEPDNPRALMLLGLALSDQAELQEAEVFLRQATKLTKEARPWYELGVVQYKRGDHYGAEESLAKAAEIEPDNELYQYVYGEMLRIQQKFDAALEAYRIAAEHEPPHPKAAAKLGLVLAETGKPAEAEVYLTEAVRKDPSNQFNYYNLAFVLNDQGKLSGALEMFNKFLSLADKSDGDRPKAEACVKLLKKRGNKKKC